MHIYVCMYVCLCVECFCSCEFYTHNLLLLLVVPDVFFITNLRFLLGVFLRWLDQIELLTSF
jgi:hypothetical protein